MKQDVFSKNSYYEGLLQNLYAGSSGCFVFFMKVFYQYNQMVVFGQENAEMFNELMVSELENCKILSQMIVELGGDNKFFSSSKKFLSGVNVEYCKSVGQMFMSDIETLETHVIEVKNLIAKIENFKIREKLKTILKNKQEKLIVLRKKFFKNNLI